MIDLLLAFDNEDNEMGAFNRGCIEDFQQFLNGKNYNSTFILSKTLNSINIQLRAEQLNAFVFVAYSHGENNKLLCNGNDYISVSENHTLFNNAFFYTVSCFTASELGNVLISNNCLSFFGYKSLFNFWDGYKHFAECANHGFLKFIEGATTERVYNLMIENYNNNIDIVYKDDYLVASLLKDNRDGLVRMGQNIDIQNLIGLNNN